ncbi:MAG: Fic/DOC family N-terminal domain-containing protein, partial [Gammaproteobacteria bacterium]
MSRKLVFDIFVRPVELKQAGGLLPNPTILINTIPPVLEARASSEIENIVTTTDLKVMEKEQEQEQEQEQVRSPCAMLLYRGFSFTPRLHRRKG